MSKTKKEKSKENLDSEVQEVSSLKKLSNKIPRKLSKKNSMNFCLENCDRSIVLIFGVGTILLLSIMFVFLASMVDFRPSGTVAGFRIENVDGDIDCARFNELYKEVLKPSIEDKVLEEELSRVYKICAQNRLGSSWPSSFDVFRR